MERNWTRKNCRANKQVVPPSVTQSLLSSTHCTSTCVVLMQRRLFSVLTHSMLRKCRTVDGRKRKCDEIQPKTTCLAGGHNYNYRLWPLWFDLQLEMAHSPVIADEMGSKHLGRQWLVYHSPEFRLIIISIIIFPARNICQLNCVQSGIDLLRIIVVCGR